MRIKVGKSNFALVDKEDYSELSKYTWVLFQGYAGREVVVSKNPRVRKTIKMHRQVMNFPEQIIDHKNQNKLDNRKINLALSDKSKNGINRNAQINSKSGIKGVCFDNSKNRWRVFINKAGIRLGDRLFKDFITAVLYRKFLEGKYHADL